MKLKTLLVTLTLAVFSTALAFADDPAESKAAKVFKPYAQVRAYLGYKGESKELSGCGEADIDYVSKLSALSRVGGNFEYGNITGKVEVGLKSKTVGAEAIYLRQAYGVYTFDAIKVTAGYAFAPYTNFSSMVSWDNCGVGYGALYGERELQFKVDVMGAYLDLMRTENDIAGIDTDYIDTYIPRFAVGYDYKDKMIKAGLGFTANWVTVNEEDGIIANGAPASTLDGESIFAWMAYAHALIKIDAIKFKANLAYSQGADILGVNSGVTNTTAINANTDGFDYAKVLEGYVEAGYTVEMITPLVGFAYAQSDSDAFTEKDKQWAVYAQAAIAIEKNFIVTPEFAYFNKMKDETGVDEGTEWYAGARVMFKL